MSSFGLAWINRTPESGNVEAAARRPQADGDTVEWWRTDEDPLSEEAIEDAAEPEAILEGENDAEE